MARLAFSLGLILLIACGDDSSTDDSDNPVGRSGSSGKGGKGGSSGSSGKAQGGSSGDPGQGGSGAGMSGGSGQGGAGASGAGAGGAGAGGAGQGGAGAGGAGAGGAGAGGAVGGAGPGGAGAGGAGAGGGGAGGAGAGGGAGGSAAGGGAACVPTTLKETACNGVDDDCNGIIDDVDAANDGICDCLRIGIIGAPGSNPSSNFQSWLSGFGSSVQRVNQDPAEAFDAALLSGFDVAILDRLVRPYTEAEAAALGAWVDGGKGFIAMTGYNGQPAPDFYPNVFLKPFGLEYQGALSSGAADQFFPHPTTEGVSSVTFAGGYLIKQTPVDGVLATLIAANKDGNVGYAVERKKGRGVVWGDEWIEFDSEWQALPQIQKFWVNMVNWVSPRDYCVVVKP